MCPTLSISTKEAATSCISCVANSFADDTRIVCDCYPGFFGTKTKSQTQIGNQTFVNLECIACPKGAKCTDSGVTFDHLQTQAGWWRANNQSLTFYPCLVAAQCAGGNQICGGHRAGPLCGLCQPGYQGKTSDAACHPCPNEQLALVGAVFLTLLFVVGLGVLYYFVWKGADLQARAAEVAAASASKRESLRQASSARLSTKTLIDSSGRSSGRNLKKGESKRNMTAEEKEDVRVSVSVAVYVSVSLLCV